jgi:hypothetical protein
MGTTDVFYIVAFISACFAGIECDPSCVGMTKMRGPPLTPPKEGKDCGNVILAKLAGISCWNILLESSGVPHASG